MLTLIARWISDTSWKIFSSFCEMCHLNRKFNQTNVTSIQTQISEKSGSRGRIAFTKSFCLEEFLLSEKRKTFFSWRCQSARIFCVRKIIYDPASLLYVCTPRSFAASGAHLDRYRSLSTNVEFYLPAFHRRRNDPTGTARASHECDPCLRPFRRDTGLNVSRVSAARPLNVSASRRTCLRPVART